MGLHSGGGEEFICGGMELDDRGLVFQGGRHAMVFLENYHTLLFIPLVYIADMALSHVQRMCACIGDRLMNYLIHLRELIYFQNTVTPEKPTLVR